MCLAQNLCIHEMVARLACKRTFSKHQIWEIPKSEWRLMKMMKMQDENDEHEPGTSWTRLACSLA